MPLVHAGKPTGALLPKAALQAQHIVLNKPVCHLQALRGIGLIIAQGKPPLGCNGNILSVVQDRNIPDGGVEGAHLPQKLRYLTLLQHIKFRVEHTRIGFVFLHPNRIV